MSYFTTDFPNFRDVSNDEMDFTEFDVRQNVRFSGHMSDRRVVEHLGFEALQIALSNRFSCNACILAAYDQWERYQQIAYTVRQEYKEVMVQTIYDLLTPLGQIDRADLILEYFQMAIQELDREAHAYLASAAFPGQPRRVLRVPDHLRQSRHENGNSE